MRKILSLFLIIVIYTSSFSQEIRKNKADAVWDQGIPVCPEDQYISGLIEKLGGDSLLSWEIVTSKSKAKVCREIGIAFYDKGMYDAADWYLTKSRNYKEESVIEEQVELKTPKPSLQDIENMKADLKFLEDLPQSYEKMTKSDIAAITKKIEIQIKKLIKEKDSLLKTTNVSKEIISAKENAIGALKKEKQVIDLSVEKEDLKIENKEIRKYLLWAGISLAILVLLIIALLQRKTIKVQDKEIDAQLKDIIAKNTYLEHAARIIRHDMHSGINTYLPRGINSLEKKLDEETIKSLRLAPSLTMIKEGLSHTQRVYKSVYEFTNLVKRKSVIEKTKVDLTALINNFINGTSYKNQVMIEELVETEVNESLFCTAIDNLIRNGLKYNDSSNKVVQISFEEGALAVQDNGRGFSQADFEKILFSKNDDDSGLGLKIANAIFSEHGFKMGFEKNNIGTKVKITLNLK
jgi:signal transduction histidine kinase